VPSDPSRRCRLPRRRRHRNGHPRRRPRRYCLVPGPAPLTDVPVGASPATARTTPALAETAPLTTLVGSQRAVHLTVPGADPRTGCSRLSCVVPLADRLPEEDTGLKLAAHGGRSTDPGIAVARSPRGPVPR
jgi:hypothetical protein